MSTTYYQSDADSRRTRMLGTMAIVAALLHAAVLYGVGSPPLQRPAPAQEQDVTIDLAPVLPHSGGRYEVSEPVPPEPPAPAVRQPEPEPLPVPPKLMHAPQKVHPVQRQKPKSAAVTRTGQTNTPPQTAGAAQKASRPVTSSPEPLSSYSNPKPVYPELARKRGQEGQVLLAADIDEKGELMELRVNKSSGFFLLDEAALQAVRRWHFKPALRAGIPVRGTAFIPVEFLLKG